ncbi:TolC family protein [Oceanospirillum sediminis]|uniref:TolC family protein n=1 Tax=Oceanospirillum sediminis TaxID=2760088 RepID=A0A839IX92_9GAMM|nr:TolC family protein [Oceanospirillum sediminis]MBB1489412.1 TolC family protein [Oceanospirillum sediminis]
MSARFLWLAVAITASNLSHAQVFNLDQAEEKALQQDFLQQTFSYRQQSILAQGEAAAQWSDPTFKVGLANIPMDSLRLNDDPMTQLVLGVSQALPRGDSLSIKRSAAQLKSSQLSEQSELRKLQVRQKVRTLWFDIHYRIRVQQILKHKQQVIRQNLDNMVSGFALGAMQSQDLLEAELELDRIREKIMAHQQKEQALRVQLSRWTGQPADQYLQTALPDWTSATLWQSLNNLTEQQQMLLNHPVIRQIQTEVRYQQNQVELARTAYDPAFRIDISYGHRWSELPNGSDRSDLLSAFVTVDVPLFPEKRQDRQYQAAVYQVSAAQAERDERLRQYQGELSEVLTQLQFIQQRLSLYQDKLLPQAKSRIQASEQAYQANTGVFDRLTQAYTQELNLNLEYQKLRTEQAQLQTRLRFFQGL